MGDRFFPYALTDDVHPSQLFLEVLIAFGK